MLRYANLILLILFPISWTVPLMRAGVALPFFGKSEVTVLSGVVALWDADIFLALVVIAFAMLAPMVKTALLAAIHFGRASPRHLGLVGTMGKLAMADVFLIALYVVVLKGVSFASVEVATGLYLFTGCILASIALTLATPKSMP